jgi:hypothetical protein
MRLLKTFIFLILYVYPLSSYELNHRTFIKNFKKLSAPSVTALSILGNSMFMLPIDCVYAQTTSQDIVQKIAASQGASTVTSRRLGLVKGLLTFNR